MKISVIMFTGIFRFAGRLTMNNKENCFESLTIFILASNETASLNNTISKIKKLQCFKDVCRVVIVIKDAECPAYSEAEKIIAESGSKFEMYIQKSGSLELCIAELPPLVKSTHFVITVADGEMKIENIDTFVSKVVQHPERIICAAKWHKDSTVTGYGHFNAFGSRCINLFISVLFRKKVTDPFSIYQIFPISVYKRLKYKETWSFCYEYTLKPLRCGIEYEEIPTVYRKRTDGKTNFNYINLFRSAFLFCLVALKIRFAPKEDIF